MKLRRRLRQVALAALIALIGVVAVRTAKLSSRQIAVAPATLHEVDVQAAAERLAGAIRVRSIAHQEGTVDRFAFEQLHAYLRHSFPDVHGALERERIADLSLLYRWQGSDASLEPLLLLAHLDVVPVADREAWTHPPFEGVIADGFVWGRGALDDKAALLGILEAVELLVDGGFRPRRTVLLAFGHDEEVRGSGAQAIAAHLRQRGTRLHMVLDEGSAIVSDLVPGVKAPVALIGVTEKGYATIELTARGQAGHSMMPPPSTATGTLARVIQRIEANQMPAAVDGPVAAQLEYLGPEMGLGMRLAIANRWLFGGVIEGVMTRKPSGNAQLRTTAAVTMLEGSIKENVLPAHATATVNFRIKPGDSVEEVLGHVNALVGDASVDVKVRPGASDPPAASPIDGSAFTSLHRVVKSLFAEVVLAPSLVIATTDARHYAQLSDNIYRFLPIRLGPDDLPRFHGVDERIAIDNHGELIQFYARLIEQVAGQ